MIIWWLRRDPRLDDNTALFHAFEQSGGAVLPLFVLDDAILDAPTMAASRVHLMMEALRELDGALRERGSRLILRRGTPVATLVQVVAESGAEAVFWNRDYEPFAIERDTAVQTALTAQGTRVETFADHVLVEPHEITTNEGKWPTVYTPYSRRWRARIESDAALVAKRGDGQDYTFQPLPDLETLPVPSAQELGFALTQNVITPGAAAGRKQLEDFVRRTPHGLREYHQQRNSLAIDGTSRLGPHFRLGTLVTRSAARVALAVRNRSEDADERKACDVWLGELAWRDFYMQILQNFPQVISEPFRPAFAKFPYRDDPDGLLAWQQGRTGYPVVDAGMRQLNTEAFMHNRARMITASFLTKDLLVDYRHGERYFNQNLACGETAANNGGWQWVAGSGNDAQPFFRIFNPITQSETYDPNGDYIRRYVPELERVPTRYIHAPWTMPADIARAAGIEIGRDYPAPIVDHKMARDRALHALQTIREEKEKDEPTTR